MIIKSDEHKKWFQKEYHRIKESMSCSIWRDLGECMSEDIFHDTILKVNNIKAWKEMKPSDYENYLYQALRNNMLREKQYSRNKNTRPLKPEHDPSYNHYGNLEYWLGREEVTEWIKNKYGPIMVDLFGTIIFEGTSIRSLEHKFPGLRYRMKKILQWIGSHYDKEYLLEII